MISYHSSVRVDLVLETGGGGSGQHVLDLYRGLRSHKWDAHLVLSSRRIDSNFAAEIERLPKDDITYIDVHRSPHPSDLLASEQLRRAARHCKGYILHGHSTKAGLLGCIVRTSNIRRVLTPHAYRGMDPSLRGLKRAAIQRAEALFSRAYDAIIAVSPEESAYIDSLGIRPERVHFIPNGIDVEGIASIAARVRATRRTGPPVIGFLGRLVYQKNAVLFVEMLRLLVTRGVEFRAHIVGEGDQRASLEKMVARYKLTHLVEWRGNVSGIEELGHMDVMVHTSRYESFPYTLLEASAAGVPVVAVENAGSHAIFADLLPEAIVQSSPDALADAVAKVLCPGQIREHFSTAGKAIVRSYQLDTMVRRTIKVYETVLENSRS